MNYVELYQAIQDYTEDTEALFVANIPTFVKQAESRIYNAVNLPSLRKNVQGTVTAGNQFLSLPNDWLATYSISLYDTDGNVNYLLNKDSNYIREAYPNRSASGRPKYYALFGAQYTDVNEMSYIFGPTPDLNYGVELNYFYYPPTIVQGEIATFSATITGGTNYSPGVYINIPLTGGSGSGATANIVVSNTGAVTSVDLDNGGQFYVVGDVLSASTNDLGIAGANFAVTVATVTNSTGRSWVGDNYDPVLLYGSMREAMLFMKQEADLVSYYEQKYMEALKELNRLSQGLDRGDFYRDGETKLNANLKGDI